jgi:hypothetical protein
MLLKHISPPLYDMLQTPLSLSLLRFRFVYNAIWKNKVNNSFGYVRFHIIIHSEGVI